MKRLMRYTAVVLATLLVLAGLWQFRLILLLFVFSLFTAATVRPFVVGLTERGLPKTAAQGLVYLGGLSALLIISLLIGDPFLRELNSLMNLLVIEYEALHRTWQSGLPWQQTAVSLLPPPFTSTTATSTDLEQMMPTAVTLTRTLTNTAGALLLVLVLSAYWSADQHRFERLWLSLLPARSRAYARDSWRQIETAVGGYIMSQTTKSLLAALLLGLGAALLGLTYPLLWALMGAVAAFVPLFGGLAAAAAAFGLASLESVGLGVGAAVYTLAVFLLLQLVVEPRLWPRERRFFLVTILVIIVLTDAFGLWGLIIAPTLATALEVLIRQAYQAALVRSRTAVVLDDLESRYQETWQKTSLAEYGEVTPELRNLSLRLSELLTQSRQADSSI